MSYIYPTEKKEGIYYKAYFVYKTYKIYLGYFTSSDMAQKALDEAEKIMAAPCGVPVFNNVLLSDKKIVCLSNLRDHKTFIKNPIYLHTTYFSYYLSKETILLFDLKDLFYFSTYKIYKRGNYLYVQDSISQQNLLSRFGINSYAAPGRDYRFKNNNPFDLRRENIEIINNYKGVTRHERNGTPYYITKIFINRNVVVGHYSSEIEAAIAYNKAIDLLNEQNTPHNYISNTLPYLTKKEYDAIYERLTLSPRILQPTLKRRRVASIKKLRGTCLERSSYKASIGYEGQQLYLGKYPTEKRAAQAYNYASLYLYGRQGYINSITPTIHESDISKIAGHLSKYGIKK